ncbi:hypothetical protein FraQA3DRAFT_4103 [Frankia sp. QA3]|nr:hypothetical protein FraQA3DRAFT_4103 [Frankia sp. QA3]
MPVRGGAGTSSRAMTGGVMTRTRFVRVRDVPVGPDARRE